MSKFSDRLKKDKDAIKAEEVTLAEAGAKAQTEQKISSLKLKAATLQQAYNAAFSTNFNIERVFSLTQEIEQNSKDLALAEQILTDEFAA